MHEIPKVSIRSDKYIMLDLCNTPSQISDKDRDDMIEGLRAHFEHELNQLLADICWGQVLKESSWPCMEVTGRFEMWPNGKAPPC